MNIFFKSLLSFVFILIINSSVSSQTQWTRQITPVSTNLTRIIFIDTLKGWAAGDSGHIIHTTNGGTNWIAQSTSVPLKIDDLFFLNTSTGWALSNDYLGGTYIFKTTNAGANWNFSRFSDSTHFFSTIFFNNINTGFLAGNEGVILKTTDSGNNWLQCSVDSSLFYRYPIQKITFYNDRIGTASGGTFDIQGVIWQTTNSGLNWVSHGLGGEPIARVKYLDSFNIIGIGGDHEFGASKVQSTDGGRNWSYVLLGLFGQGYSIEDRNVSELFVPLGYAQAFAKSVDGGRNWTSISTPDSAEIYDIVFKDEIHGWCCGTNGRVYQYNNVVSINTLSSSVPDNFHLYQNYPNPFNPSTIIRFTVPVNNSDVKLSIYDILGKNIKTLIDKNLNTGTYEVSLDASELSGGIYFYSLRSGNYFEIKKMMLIK
ncbi:hypothetical protein BH10BAC5_BH10BAC5_05580 [soil metagenome]